MNNEHAEQPVQWQGQPITDPDHELWYLRGIEEANKRIESSSKVYAKEVLEKVKDHMAYHEDKVDPVTTNTKWLNAVNKAIAELSAGEEPLTPGKE